MIPVAAPFKARDCDRSLAGLVVSNPAGDRCDVFECRHESSIKRTRFIRCYCAMVKRMGILISHSLFVAWLVKNFDQFVTKCPSFWFLKKLYPETLDSTHLIYQNWGRWYVLFCTLITDEGCTRVCQDSNLWPEVCSQRVIDCSRECTHMVIVHVWSFNS